MAYTKNQIEDNEELQDQIQRLQIQEDMLAHQEEAKEEQKEVASYVGGPTGLAPKRQLVMNTPTGRKPPKKYVQAFESLAELGFGYVGQSEITMWHRPTKD